MEREIRKKGWMPANQRAKCDFIHCMAGMGLAGNGCCFLNGEWWKENCPQFKREELEERRQNGNK